MKTNQIQVNPLTHVPDHLNDIAIDYRHIMKKVMRYIDPTGYQPFVDWSFLSRDRRFYLPGLHLSL